MEELRVGLLVVRTRRHRKDSMPSTCCFAVKLLNLHWLTLMSRSVVCRYLKGHGMAGFLSNNGPELCEKLFQEVKALLKEPEKIRSVSTIKLI